VSYAGLPCWIVRTHALITFHEERPRLFRRPLAMR
jgi:hypothetical protein